MKQCTTCKAQKSKSEFSKDKNHKDGLRSQCKQCVKIQSKKYRESDSFKERKEEISSYMKSYVKDNKEKITYLSKMWRENNKNRIALYREENKERIAYTKRVWHIKNKDKNKHRQKLYRAKNKKEIALRQSIYRKNHPEKRASYREKNKDAIAKQVAKYSKANPESNRNRWHKRRALKANSCGTLSKGLAKKLFTLQKGKCPCCRKPLGNNYHMDHIMPLALGGENTDDNIQLLRSTCNLSKGAKHPVDFMQSRGFLF